MPSLLIISCKTGKFNIIVWVMNWKLFKSSDTIKDVNSGDGKMVRAGNKIFKIKDLRIVK